jgi:hypothetical protein
MGSRRCLSSNPRQVDKGRDKAGAVGAHEAARTAGVVGTVQWRSDSDMASVWRGRNGKCSRYNGLVCAWALNAGRVGSGCFNAALGRSVPGGLEPVVVGGLHCSSWAGPFNSFPNIQRFSN